MTDVSRRGPLPQWRPPLIDRSALLDRLGEIEQPPPDVHAWLARATLAAGLPGLVGLDQRSSYDLCQRVIAHLTGRPVRRR
jgi:hypothetical protein